MRVVQLINNFDPAGAERVTADLAAGLRARAVEVEVLSLLPNRESSPVMGTLRNAGVPVHSLDSSRATPWRALALGERLRSLRPDVVHAHLYQSILLSRLLPWRRRFVLVNTIHNVERRNLAWRFAADRVTHGRCNRVTAVSAAAASFYAAKTRVPREEIRVIHNGVKPPEPVTPGQRSRLREEWGVADCARVLGGVGRLVEPKGFDRLLELLPDLAPAVPPGKTWGVVLLGDGPHRPQLERLAARAPSCFRVRLPGFHPRASHAAGAFDVMAIPSRTEGFGLVAAEAMAHGLPVVASNRDSLPELLEGYTNGSVVDFFAADPGPAVSALADRLREPAARTPRHTHDIDRMVDDYLSLYKELLHGKRS